jgi:hypothetical protein
MLTTKQLETTLYALEGYIQGNSDYQLVDELVTICTQLIEEEIPVSESEPFEIFFCI